MDINEENKELLYEYCKTQNKEIYEKIFMNNIKLIDYVINKFIVTKANISLERKEDLHQIGCVGLLKAIKAFDINRIDEISFSTFAVTYIKNEFYYEFSRDQRFVKPSVSLDEYVQSDNQCYTIGDLIEDENNCIEEYDEEDLTEYKKKKISELLENFDERRKQIISLYYGIGGNKPLTQQQIAKIFNCTRANINSIVSNVNKLLAEELNEFKSEYVSADNVKIKAQNKHQLIELYGEKFVREVFDSLNENDKTIISLYYGFNGDEPISQINISKKVNIYPSYICIVIKEFNNKLRRKLKESHLSFKKV